MTLDLSVVIAVNNEEKNIGVLYGRLKKTLDTIDQSYEIIFVEDGSRDNTYTELCGLHRNDRSVNVVRLKKNYGQTMGLLVGMNFARAATVITMDGDLQHDPDDIPKFLNKINLGYDLVNGRKTGRPDSLLKRTLPSLVVKQLVCWAYRSDYLDINSTFRAYRRRIVEDIKRQGEAFRFLPLVVRQRKIDFCEVAIACKKREFGKTHYHLTGRLKRLAKDLLILWSIRNQKTGLAMDPDGLVAEVRFHEESRAVVVI
jgi:glycosyltransferase involved in cell wall biosynthesis